MPRPRVYIETTIPSAYLEERRTPEMLARRRWTREWWAAASTRWDLVSSVVLIEELLCGTQARVMARLALVRQVRILKLTQEIDNATEFYIAHKVMPESPDSDATHLAAASYHGCEFLVSWNYRHLVNPNKFQHIRKINDRLGLSVPKLVTPITLLRGADEATVSS